MPVFSEQIQGLCDAVFASKCERAEAVADVKSQTDQLLDANRQQLQAVRDEQREAAARGKADLAANCRERSEQVQAFRDRVRSERHAAAEQLRQKLEQNQQERQETVSAMLDGYNQVQRAFGEQCQAASQLWREMQERPVGNG